MTDDVLCGGELRIGGVSLQGSDYLLLLFEQRDCFVVVPLRSSREGLVSWVEVDEARALRTIVLGASPGRAAIESRLILLKVVVVSGAS
jgi:hypothetical protein